MVHTNAFYQYVVLGIGQVGLDWELHYKSQKFLGWGGGERNSTLTRLNLKYGGAL